MFVVGLFPAVVAFFIRRNLREPELFLEKVVRAKERPQSLRLLVKPMRRPHASASA